MVESYGIRSGSRRTSWKTIQEMKKNMQKVPIIQEKAQAYHAQEQSSVEQILDLVDEQENTIPVIQEDAKKLTRREQIWEKISFTLFAKDNDNN